MPRRSCTELQRGHCACDSSQSLPMFPNGMTWSPGSSSSAPTQGSGAPMPYLYKARRSGSTLKKKISALSWNDLSDEPERRQVFMWTQALHLLLSKGHLGWDGYIKSSVVQAPAQSRITCDTRPRYSSLSKQLLKPPATEPTQPVWWFLPLSPCPHGQQIALYIQSASHVISQLQGLVLPGTDGRIWLHLLHHSPVNTGSWTLDLSPGCAP